LPQKYLYLYDLVRYLSILVKFCFFSNAGKGEENRKSNNKKQGKNGLYLDISLCFY